VNPETVTYESLRTGDMRFAYHRAGHGGAPIVLLHGWPQTSRAWRRVTPLLNPLCDVVVPHLPGFGYWSEDRGRGTYLTRLRSFSGFIKPRTLPRRIPRTVFVY
jgi:pimeloyl-ACP methyl ester carboxylesterase